MNVFGLAAFAASNVALYGLLSRHYHDVCRASWWSFFAMRQSLYCAAVERGLGVLQFAPLLAIGHVAGWVSTFERT
jgi:hypothetical protein